MKHNEIKAYFKNKLKEKLTNYDVLSVDETMSSRNLYIIDKQTFETKMLVTTWFGTNEFDVKAFILDENTKINKYADYFVQAKGNYMQLKHLGNIIQSIFNKLLQKS